MPAAELARLRADLLKEADGVCWWGGVDFSKPNGDVKLKWSASGPAWLKAITWPAK